MLNSLLMPILVLPQMNLLLYVFYRLVEWTNREFAGKLVIAELVKN